jgi:hypothetical protein
MLGAEYRWEGSEFLNYWNLNQTFLLEGRSTKMMFEKFLTVVKKRSACKITEGSLKVQSLLNHQIKQQIKWLAA